MFDEEGLIVQFARHTRRDFRVKRIRTKTRLKASLGIHGAMKEEMPFKNGRIIFRGEPESWDCWVDGSPEKIAESIFEGFPDFKNEYSAVKIYCDKKAIILKANVKFAEGGALKVTADMRLDEGNMFISGLRVAKGENGELIQGTALKLFENIKKTIEKFNIPLDDIFFKAGAGDGPLAWLRMSRRRVPIGFRNPIVPKKLLESVYLKWKEEVRPELEKVEQNNSAIQKVEDIFGCRTRRINDWIEGMSSNEAKEIVQTLAKVIAPVIVRNEETGKEKRVKLNHRLLRNSDDPNQSKKMKLLDIVRGKRLSWEGHIPIHHPTDRASSHITQH